MLTDSGNLPPQFKYDRFVVPSNLELTMHFAPHGNHLDLPPNLDTLLRTTDAVIVETVGQTEMESEILNGVAQADATAVKVARSWVNNSDYPAWKSTFYEALRGCGATVLLPDLTASHPLLTEYEVVSRDVSIAVNQTDFEFMMDVLQKAIPLKFNLLKKRDQLIIENIASGISLIMDEADVRPFTAVGFYGGAHIGIADALAHKSADDQSVSVKKVTDLGIASIHDELYQKYLRGESHNYLERGQFALEAIWNITHFHGTSRSSRNKLPTHIAFNELYQQIASLDKRDIRAKHAEAIAELCKLKR